MTESALECALALKRAPLMAPALRERALPADIGQVIGIAAGSKGEAALAADATGETPVALVEAARFYLQQVLLFPEADAYRVLGVSRDASMVQIRHHHRSLQRWLHPDRSADPWEAIYATRVNQAWSRLRSAQARAQYDDGLQHQRGLVALPEASDARWRWRPVEVERSIWRLHPSVPVGIVLAACVVLAWQAATRDRIAVSTRSELAGPAGSGRAATSAPRASVAPGAAAMAVPSVDAMPRPPRILAGADLRARPPTQDTPTPQAAVAGLDARSVDARAPDAAGVQGPSEPDVARAVEDAVHTNGTPNAEVAKFEPDAAMYAQAQRRGEQLLAYLDDPEGRVPPIWDSVVAMEAAAVVRQAVLGGGSGAHAWREPSWRLAADRAELTVDLQRGRWLATSGRGRLHAALRLREGDWRVAGVRWEPAR